MDWSWLRHHVMHGHAGNVVYGSIVVLALVLVLDHEHADATTAIASLVGAVVVVAVAEAYAEVLQGMIAGRHRLTQGERREIAAGISVHAVAAAAPVAFLVLARIDVLGLETAYVLAKWFGVAILGLYAFGAYRAAGVSIGRSIVAGAILTAVGLVCVALKSLVGH